MLTHVHNGISSGKLFHVIPRQNPDIQQMEYMTHQSLVLILVQIIQSISFL